MKTEELLSYKVPPSKEEDKKDKPIIPTGDGILSQIATRYKYKQFNVEEFKIWLRDWSSYAGSENKEQDDNREENTF